MWKATLTAAVLALGATTAFAAAPDGILLSKDKRTVISTRLPTHFTPPLQHEPGLKPIFSNIGTAYPKGLYFGFYGNTISGPSSAIGQTYWLAGGFTPAANAEVEEVDAAVGYVEGTNEVVLTLYDDAAGVPGNVLKSWKISGLGTFGSCCQLAVGKYKKGIPVTAGAQYWVAVTTSSKGADTWAAWNFNSTNQVDALPIAVSNGAGWSASSEIPGVSFGVYGK